MTWQIDYREGLYLPQIEWWLDARRPVLRSFVSHAHFDHLGRHAEILCSAATARFIRCRLPKKKRIEHILPFGQTEQLTADCTITLLPAGHILGSAQCLLEHEKLGSLLYTGDFKLRPGLVSEPCVSRQADVLVMETTFGRPRYILPPQEKVRADIIDFCRRSLTEGSTPVLMAYSLGKSQELLACLGTAGLPVMLHPQVLEMTQLHVDLGVSLPAFAPFDQDKLAGQVVISPPLSPKAGFLLRIPQHRTAFISGWALDRSTVFRQRCDAAFPLSDHADYQELLDYVDQVKPKKVYTLHGFAAEFSEILRERGVDALALGEANQLSLGITS
jgi:Cft2 family RNA processing exonuclease